MCRNLKETLRHKCYLGIFSLVEGTKLDRFVRKVISRIYPGEDLERQVELFYVNSVRKMGKILLGFLVVGGMVDDKRFWVLLCGCIGISTISPVTELHSRLKKRNEDLTEGYSLMVTDLLLYINAGLSTRTAFEKAARRFEKKTSMLGMEMNRCVNHLKAGYIETECYYCFGKRCDLPEYLRLGGLLAQNVNKGNRELIHLLESEQIEAYERKRHLGRRKGEQATTKLLGPMMLLLAMVLIMVMIPAFGSI